MKHILIILIFTIVSCSNDNFIESSKLGKLKVIAIQADKPEINNASTITITPLVSYIEGGNTTLDYSWEACPDPGINFGAESNCESSPSSLKLSGSSTYNTSLLASTKFTGNLTPLSLVIPANYFIYLSSLDQTIQYNGLDLIVIITLKDQLNSVSTKAIKRIRLSTKPSIDLNTNPSFASIQFNQSNLSSFPVEVGNMSLSGTSSAESYSLETNVGLKSFTEEMTISWYASDGTFLFNRRNKSEENQYTPEGSSGVFIAVYRDGRGGVFSQILNF